MNELEITTKKGEKIIVIAVLFFSNIEIFIVKKQL